jgi:hypothetical protein
MRWAKSEKSGPHQLRTVLVFPMIYRVSTIRSVVQDFATIHRIMGMFGGGF